MAKKDPTSNLPTAYTGGLTAAVTAAAPQLSESLRVALPDGQPVATAPVLN